MHQKGLNYYIISQKASASGGRSPPDPQLFFLFFSKIKQFPEIKYLIHIFVHILFCSWMCLFICSFVHEWTFVHLFMNVGNWTCSRTMHVVVYFKRLPQICTKMNGFKFDFLKIFWGGAHRAPSPDPSPVFSRASPSVRASPSILRRFAPSTRASPSILGSVVSFAVMFPRMI